VPDDARGAVSRGGAGVTDFEFGALLMAGAAAFLFCVAQVLKGQTR
jgi:hypothetical protein